MGFTCGIIGLPNVGKSTIFNALTSAKAAAANFPFCTIEPNTGMVNVRDPRLEKLAEINKSAKVIPAQMQFVDIAGLIRGASKGEGLGNQFLGHIRSVDALAHVVRCFTDSNVTHVDGGVDPVRDIQTIDTELILSDLDTVSKQISKWEKNLKSGEKDPKIIHAQLKQLETALSNATPARAVTVEDPHPEYLLVLEQLLTAKPTLFVANVDEAEAASSPEPGGTRPLDKLGDYAKSIGSEVVVISGKVESEIAELAADERKDYLDSLGLTLSGLDRLTLAGYKLLGLITYFTAGPKESRAWTIRKGTLAPQAAGKIHTDFERGFIRAEVISADEYLKAGSEVKAKEAGKLRIEGKEYVFQDGDVVLFRFNV